MNKLTIIGNISNDPTQKTTQNGVTLTTFSVAVNRRRTQEGQPEADFFRVTAWRQLGENCAKYLSKGKKVCVVGPVSVNTYQGNDGKTRATLEVTAEDVEFLSPKDDAPAKGKAKETEAEYVRGEREAIRNENRYVVVDDGEGLPFEIGRASCRERV